MKILLIVHFHENVKYIKSPSPHTGVYGLLTEDESVMEFHNRALKEIPFGDQLYHRMKHYFYSDYSDNKFAAWRYLDKRFQILSGMILNTKEIDKIVICEV